MSNDRESMGRGAPGPWGAFLFVAVLLAAPSAARAAAGRAHGVLLVPGLVDQGALKLDWVRDTIAPTEDWHVVVISRTPQEQGRFKEAVQTQNQWANRLHYPPPGATPETTLQGLRQQGIRNVIVVIDMNVDWLSPVGNGRSEHRWAARQSAKWERSLRATYPDAAVGAVSHSFGNGAISGGLLKAGLALDYWVPASPGSSRAKLNVASRKVRNHNVLSLLAIEDFHKLVTVDGPADFDYLTIERHAGTSTGPHSIMFDANVVDTSTKYSSSLNLARPTSIREAIRGFVDRASSVTPTNTAAAGQSTFPQATTQQPRPEVADYYTTAAPDVPLGKTRTEARAISGLAGGAKRAVVYGSNPAADITEREMVAKLGRTSVRRVRQDPTDGRELQAWARAFDADVLLGVRQHSNGAPHDSPRAFRDRIDPPAHSGGAGPGGPPPPPDGVDPQIASAAPRTPVDTWRRNRVGGVLLQDVAEISGGAGAELTNASFSLVFDRSGTGLDVDELRRFVTALWAVYFSEEGPGISIDPIAPDVDKHLVRYIGHVVNSDLGRVMREADYLMKRWAVGTVRSDLPGFRNPDDIAGQRGQTDPMGSSRFWFVPEDMRFRKAEGLLLFDDGRMTLKTESLSGDRNGQTHAANDAWAAWVTEHYADLAARHSVLEELFEYAKMVSLAKHLKQQGTPLLWYLLANKDLLLTEDSPGTVDALAVRSRHFDHVEIRGGVDLAQTPRPAQYVVDQDVMAALGKALERYSRSSTTTGTTLPAPTAVAIDADGGGCALANPQHVSLSGSGFGGDTYQTDVALRRDSGAPGLELVRYYSPLPSSIATFGNGWHLMVPYEVSPASTTTIEFAGTMVPRAMEVLNRLTGRREVLEFSAERYSIAGWVPAQADASGLVGLFLMSDASFRLADKAGGEYQFDTVGNLTDMIFTESHAVHMDYGVYEVPARSFSTVPYSLEPIGHERVSVLDATLPTRLRVIGEGGDGSEVFVFEPDNPRGTVGYVPENHKESDGRFLALRSDGSFRLDFGHGRQVDFDAAGDFEILRVPTIEAMAAAHERVSFTYEFQQDAVRIHEARVSTGGDTHVVRYGYDALGRLDRVDRPVGGVIRIHYGDGSIVLDVSASLPPSA